MSLFIGIVLGLAIGFLFGLARGKRVKDRDFLRLQQFLEEQRR